MKLEHEIRSDGNRVWVNAPICVARFCRLSHEVLEMNTGHVETVPHGREVTLENWKHFVKEVF
jgi:hypothetical protein